MKHLLSISDLSREEIVGLMDEANRFREALEGREIKKLPTLRGRTIYSLFYENSTRTRSSFETAGKWMSADVINLSASSSSVKKGESLKDTALTLASIGADAIVMRHPSSGAAQLVADWIGENGYPTAVINAGDGWHQHPTQALLDSFTIRSHHGTLDGLRIAIVGDIKHSRVARSNVEAFTALPAARHIGARLLVVHDIGDDIVPHAHSSAVLPHVPAAKMLTTRDLGHSALTRDAARRPARHMP